MVEAHPLYEKDSDVVIGMHYDPVAFIIKHMSRFIERRELEGSPLLPGSYNLRFKVSLTEKLSCFFKLPDMGFKPENYLEYLKLG